MRTPLHPPSIGEGAASLLQDQTRPALVWTIDLDADGRQSAVDVKRALVRSRARLNYAQAQQAIDAKTGEATDGTLALLAEVGRLRQALEVERGAVSLRLPEQEVDADGNGYRLRYRAPLPARTGTRRSRCSPEWRPQDHARRRCRHLAHVADTRWRCDRDAAPQCPCPRRPLAAFRYVPGIYSQSRPGDRHGCGAARTVDTVAARSGLHGLRRELRPPQPNHSAVAAPYAHATAPLRRLVDRYVGELCVAVCAHLDVPPWIRDALPALADVMADSGHRAHALEHACIDLVETVLLATHVGETFEGTVVETGKHGGMVQLRTPPVRARCNAEGLTLGERIDVRLETADPATRTLLFARP